MTDHHHPHPHPHPATADDAAALFALSFGTAPRVIASAPGRVNLIGEHTDYNGGQVLPIAIGRRTWVAVGEGAGRRSRAVSSTVAGVGEWDPATPEPAGAWWDYVSGVTAELGARGADARAVDVAVVSDVPAGAGLSSSAALEVGAATALAALGGLELTPREVALLAHRVEVDFVGVGSGIMDQFASALARPGAALHLWCDSGRTEQVPLSESVLIFDTAVQRSLRGSAFNTRREECERALTLLRRIHPDLPDLAAASPEQVLDARLPEPLDRRALHVSEETRRVGRVARALLADGTVPATELYRSHESLRTLYDCSTPELDWFVEHAARLQGVRGARLTGAGWGGCAIAVGEVEALEAARPALATDYEVRFGLVPRVWITRAEGGAELYRHPVQSL